VVGDRVIDYSKVKVPDLTMVFPFCIPFDFGRAISSLQKEPKAPVYEIDFKGTKFGDYKWRLDMAEFESMVVYVRWGIWITFFVGLIVTTHKFIKW